jgi:signal peptidase I
MLTPQQELALRGFIMSLLVTGLMLWVVCMATSCQSRGDTRLVAPIITTVSFTGSMNPEFGGGERVLIDICPFNEALLGRVVVSWREAKKLNVMHRVIGLKTQDGRVAGLILKGDNNPERDPYITTLAEFVGCVAKL